MRIDATPRCCLPCRPMYSSAYKQGSNLALQAALEPIMQRYGVQIAFSGHDHSYVSHGKRTTCFLWLLTCRCW